MIAEVAVEAKHKKISDVLSHPGRKEQAPAFCAIMRFPQILQTSRGDTFSAWAPRQYRKRGLLDGVFSNVEDGPERKRLRNASNRAALIDRIYSAGRKEHFEDIREVEPGAQINAGTSY